jgi:hypothetical protein
MDVVPRLRGAGSGATGGVGVLVVEHVAARSPGQARSLGG